MLYYLHHCAEKYNKQMKKFNRITLLLLSMVLVLSSCKKNNDDNNNNNTGDPHWKRIGLGFFNASIFTLCFDPAGNLYAGGGFTNSNGKYFVAKWDGSVWTEVGNLNSDHTISALCSDAAGNIYASGFTNANLDGYIAKWDGSTWTFSPPVTGQLYLNTLSADAAGNVYATAGTNVYRYYNGTWDAMNMSGFDHWANNALSANGSLYVAGGAFVGGTNGAVAQWNGSGWSQLGDINTYEQAYDLCTDANGNLYASGGFDFQSGYVLKWNGTTWTDLNLNGNEMVTGIAVSNSGNLYAGGYFYNSNNKYYLAKWNGTAWSQEGVGMFNSNFLAVCAGPDGKIYSAGNFYFYENNVQKHFVAVYTE